MKWPAVALGNVVDIRTGTLNPMRFPTEQFELFSIPGFDAGTPEMPCGANIKSNKTVVLPGDVLFSKLNPRIPRIWIVSEAKDLRQISSTEFWPLVCNSERLERDYLKYFLEKLGKAGTLIDSTEAATKSRSRLKPFHLLGQMIPLPPLPEQRRIVEILDHANALRKKRIEVDMISELILPAFFQKIFGAPSNQRTKTIQELIDDGSILVHKDGNFGSDYPRDSDFGSEGVPFLSAAYIGENGIVHFKGLPRLSQGKAETLKFGRVQNGDVLFAHNAIVGRVGVLEDATEPMLIGTSLTCYRTNPETLDPYYLYALMRSPGFQRQLKAVMGQATRNQVPITAQRKLSLPIPDPHRQQVFGRVVRDLRGFIKGALQSKEALERLFGLLLQRAFTGELTQSWRQENST